MPIYSMDQITAAMKAAEKAHPMPEKHTLSKEVSRIADVYGDMVFRHVQETEVTNAALCALIDEHLAQKESPHAVTG